MKQRGISYKGQTLVEIILALTMIIALLTVAVVSMTRSLGNAQESKERNRATGYAQEGIEMVKNIRDQSWTTFSSFASDAGRTYCLADRSTCPTLTSALNSLCGEKTVTNLCTQNVVNQFKREVTIQSNSVVCTVGANSLTRVTVTLSWSDNKCQNPSTLCRSIIHETCLGNINQNSGL